MRKNLVTRIIWRIGGFMDVATIMTTTFFVFRFALEGSVEKALLALIANGVWCISISLMEIRKRIGAL